MVIYITKVYWSKDNVSANFQCMICILCDIAEHAKSSLSKVRKWEVSACILVSPAVALQMIQWIVKCI